MTKTIEQNQNTEAERLERCRQIMELRENGIWEQIHGIVLPQSHPMSTRIEEK